MHSESYDPTMQVIGGTTVAYSGIGIVLSGVKRHKSQVSSVKSQVVSGVTKGQVSQVSGVKLFDMTPASQDSTCVVSGG